MQQKRRMLWKIHEAKDGGQTCLAGCSGSRHVLYENASRRTDLCMAQRNNRTLLCGGQRKPWPALCSHARHPEHARAMLPDRCGSKYEKAGKGLLLQLSDSLHAKSPCFDLQNMGFVDGLTTLHGWFFIWFSFRLHPAAASSCEPHRWRFARGRRLWRMQAAGKRLKAGKHHDFPISDDRFISARFIHQMANSCFYRSKTML